MMRRAMRKLSRSLIILCVALVPIIGSPGAAHARQQQQEREIIDARLEGYTTNVALEEGSTALTWLFMAFLGVVCLLPMFKDAKRTHLD